MQVAYRFGHGNGAEDISLDGGIADAVVAFAAGEFPSATTVRLQAAFEGAYADAHGAVERRRRARLRRMQELLDDIVALSGKVEAASAATAAAANNTGGAQRPGGAAAGVPGAATATETVARLAEIHRLMCAYVTAYLSVDRAAAGLPPEGSDAEAAVAARAAASAVPAVVSGGGAGSAGPGPGPGPSGKGALGATAGGLGATAGSSSLAGASASLSGTGLAAGAGAGALSSTGRAVLTAPSAAASALAAVGASATVAASTPAAVAAVAAVAGPTAAAAAAAAATEAESSALRRRQPLLDGTPPEVPAAVWEGAAREVSLALESVYPRASVRSLARLPGGEAMAQLDEAAHLVLGIRIFNWAHGRGGVGIADTPGDAEKAGTAALRELERSVAAINDACGKYSDTLAALRCGALALAPPLLASAASWPSELVNRRQVALYAASLAEELRSHLAALAETAASLQAELRELASLAGSRASLPKEAVYPRFHNVAARWLRCAEIRDAVSTAVTALRALVPYLPLASVSSLPEETVRAARGAVAAGAVSAALPGPFLQWVAATQPSPTGAGSSGGADGHDDGSGGAGGGSDPDTPVRLSLEGAPEVLLSLPLECQGYCPVSAVAPVIMTPELLAAAAGAADASVAAGDGAAAAATAAAFASVPPAAALGSGLGILLPGDPGLGVVRWQGRHYTLSSQGAVAAFMAAPAFYARRVAELALQHLELVHLLQLLSPLPPFPGFCDASLPALLQTDGDIASAARAVRAQLLGPRAEEEEAAAAAAAAAAASASGEAPRRGPLIGPSGERFSKNGRRLVDAGVETPVHFVERAHDPTYEWNEWAIRRRALAMMKLRQCATTSAQTDASAFKRDNDAQVYLPRAVGTQTGIAVGVNTTAVTRHIGGLRGVPEAAVDAACAARGMAVPSHAAVAAAEDASAALPYAKRGPVTEPTVIAAAKPPAVAVTSARPKAADVWTGSGGKPGPQGTPPVALTVTTLRLDK